MRRSNEEIGHWFVSLPAGRPVGGRIMISFFVALFAQIFDLIANKSPLKGYLIYSLFAPSRRCYMGKGELASPFFTQKLHPPVGGCSFC